MNVVGFVLAFAAVHGMLLEMNTSDSSHPIGVRLGVAVGASLAAVSLLAGCGSSKSSGAKNASSGSPTTTSAAGSASSPGMADGGASPSTVASGSSSLPPKPTDPGPGGPRDCSTDMLKLTIQPLHEPVNHVMISATNTSKLPCHLNKYPLLRTYQSQPSPIGAAEASKPASAILLAPGATAYAGLMTSAGDGSGSNGKNVAALILQLQPGSAGSGGVGRPASVPMPPGATYVDSAAVVTYWESDIQSATY